MKSLQSIMRSGLAWIVMAGAVALGGSTLIAAPARIEGGAAVGASAATGTAERLSRAEIEKLFREANELFRKGLEEAKSNRTAANGRFAEAAAMWRSVASGGGIHNAKLEANIANASFLAGDLPRAIAAFRRAEALDPGNGSVRSGLAAARKAAGTEALAPGAVASTESNAKSGFADAIGRIGAFAARMADLTAAWFPPGLILGVAAGLYVLGFGLWIGRVAGVRRIGRMAPAGCLVLAVLSVGPLVARDLNDRTSREGVVVQAGLLGRSGPAELYDAAFKEPLARGIEVRITQLREGWAEIRLADGRTAWVPVTGLELL